ncbi:glycosyltransferase family 4 protein [Patescibacteria group bacterium]|nr:glycosyltransferase family 4 protein [Patescibacteria group bacterium]MBU1705464.1 glycosyltransferase family 4 protein [Patescibacteria group bacterium]
MTIIQANKYYYLRGGVERYVLNLQNWLESEGDQVVPFAMDHPNNLETPYRRFFPSYVHTEDVRLRPHALKVLARMFYSFEARRKMGDLITDVRPNLCHLHNIYTQLSPSILHPLYQNNIPMVMTVHDHHLISPQYNVWAKGCGPDYRRSGIVSGTLSRFHKQSFAASFAQMTAYKFIRARQFYERYVNLFIVPSKYLMKQLAVGGFPEEKLRHLPHGVDPGIIEPRYDHDNYMLFVGRLVPEKGVETIIRLARLLPDINFKIVGVGPAEARLHLLAHGHENIKLLGFKQGDELKDLFRGAQAVLLPSQVEDVFPLTVLEAFAAGKPVIGSHVGGVPEMIEDGRTGFLVQPTDLHGWTEAVMRLAYDDYLRTDMSKYARAAAETTFNINRHYQGLRQIYAEALRENQ